jgi:hypothetical protein
MNAQQRRRMRRIRARQRESAERRLNRPAMEFIAKHCPGPKNVCVMSDAESQRFHEVTIGHRCTSTSHRHYSRKQVDILVERGELQWIGGHHKIAAWSQHKTWQKAPSGPVTVMQLLEGLGR